VKNKSIFSGRRVFFERVEGKLAGYTWNLVGEYPYNLQLRVTEVDDGRTRTRLYLCKDRFLRQGDEEGAPFTRTLVKEAAFRVEAAVLDHRIPCLGLSLIEEFCVNIDKEALKAMGLPVGRGSLHSRRRWLRKKIRTKFSQSPGRRKAKFREKKHSLWVNSQERSPGSLQARR